MRRSGSVTIQTAAAAPWRPPGAGTSRRAGRTRCMSSKEIKRLPPDQLLEEVAEKGARAPVDDETVRREVAKDRETTPSGAPKPAPARKPG